MDVPKQFVAVSKEAWKITNHGTYQSRDEETKGKVDFQVFQLSGEELTEIANISLDVFPGNHSSSSQNISIPDFLAAVTGHNLIVVYLKEKNERIFSVYDINDKDKSLAPLNSFVMDNALPPTAIIAVKERVFLGFPGQVGYVDLLEPKPIVHNFHVWEEQKWGKNFLKTIDAFAYDSTSQSKTLVAVDDVMWPKFAFNYDLKEHPPKFINQFDLPAGINETYKYAVKHGQTLVCVARYGHRGGNGFTINIIKGEQVHESVSEFKPYEFGQLASFTGDRITNLTAVGLLHENIVLLSAGARGVIAWPIDKIEKKQLKEGDYDYEVSFPSLIRTLLVGTTTVDLATVKEKSFAYVLGTNDQKNSVLSIVQWDSEKNDLKVVRSHHINGEYRNLFVEV